MRRLDRRIPGTAIVIGAGIAGMAAARVLAKRFRRVLIIERDSALGGRRKGAPQAHHIHVLLRGGVERLERIFPGVIAEMVADGVQPIDFARDLRWLQFGDWMPRTESNVLLYPQSRSSLEKHILKRLRETPRVEILGSTTARSLLTTADRQRITGVRITAAKDSETVTDLAADLVVDAGGRGTRIFKWLSELGYDPPEETRLPIDLLYVTRLYEASADAGDWQGLWVSPKQPSVPRGGALQRIDGNRWIVSLFGYHDHHPPADEEGFLEFSKSLLDPALYHVLKNAKPASELHSFRFPAEHWLHVDRMPRFPAGLVILGDAYRTLDPLFGQGMTMALIEAEELGERLKKVRGVSALTSAWGSAYLRACAQWVGGLWSLVKAEAARHPQMSGGASTVDRALQWLVSETYALNQRHPEVYLSFLKVMHLQSGPEILLHPQISLRLASRALAQGTAKLARAAPEIPRVPAATALLWLRFLQRWVGNTLLHPLIGARDRICHYDRPFGVWEPEQGLSDFVTATIRAQGLESKAAEIRRFFDFWLALPQNKLVGKALVEFSVTTNKAGMGYMIFGDNQSITRAFAEYCRELGIADATVSWCVAVCDTFKASDMCTVRAELRPDAPTRYSLSASWIFELLRGNMGFVEKLRSLPEEHRNRAIEMRVEAASRSLAPDYYPLFFGLSFLGQGELEFKIYFLRFDEERSPFYPGSTLWRFIETLRLPAREMQRLKDFTDRIWEGSVDKMTMVAFQIAADKAAPERVNFIYCGVRYSAIKAAVESAGYDEGTKQSIAQFQEMMHTDLAKFIAIRVTPAGLSSRLKLYGHALFRTGDK